MANLIMRERYLGNVFLFGDSVTGQILVDSPEHGLRANTSIAICGVDVRGGWYSVRRQHPDARDLMVPKEAVRVDGNAERQLAALINRAKQIHGSA